MLLNSLYIILEKSIENNLVEGMIELNEAHEIFKGHFPSKAVLPGVCQVQIVKEILENTCEQKLQLTKAGEIKFLQIIVPAESKRLIFQIHYKIIEEKLLDVNAKILKLNGVVCCKMKLNLIVKQAIKNS